MQPTQALNLNDLDTFERVTRLGTLSAAARELGVPKSTIGRRITRLEKALGVALLHRGPRQIILTESGAELETRSRHALLELRELSLGLAADQPRGVLRLTVMPDLMISAQFPRMLAEFRRVYPGVILDVHATPRVTDIIAEGFDVGFRPEAAQADTDTLLVRRLATSESRLFAARKYIERRGTVAHVDGLTKHDWVSIAAHRLTPLELSGPDETRTLQPNVVAFGSDVASVLSLLRAGLGIAVLPPFYVQDDVASGVLVPLLPDWEAGLTRLLMVWPRQRFLLPRVRAFVDFIAESFGQAPGRGTATL
ncbi:MAG: LysR family transcriptional regulator [Myxococcota bacterium]